MTLQQLLASDAATQGQYALVFGTQLKNVLRTRWEEFGNNNLVPTPMLLTDGRWILCADILSEVSEDEDSRRLLGRMWRNSNRQVIAAGITVMPWADAVAMIPVSEGP